MSTSLSSNKSKKCQYINWFAQVSVRLFKYAGRNIRQRIAYAIAWLILSLASKTRTRAMANIARALPHLSHNQVREIAFTSYKNIVFGVLECFWLSELEFEYEIDPQTMDILRSGIGVSVATMHMSCYEAVPFAIHKLTERSTTLSNIPEFLTCAEKVYLDMGVDCVNKKQSDSFFKLLRAIKQKRIVSLHSDHYANDIELSFFEQKTGAPCGAAMLSAYGKTPLLLSYALLQKNGKYKVYIETVSPEPIAPNEVALGTAMEQVYSRFEQVIRQYPEQWYWSYKRWR